MIQTTIIKSVIILAVVILGACKPQVSSKDDSLLKQDADSRAYNQSFSYVRFVKMPELNHFRLMVCAGALGESPCINPFRTTENAEIRFLLSPIFATFPPNPWQKLRRFFLRNKSDVSSYTLVLVDYKEITRAIVASSRFDGKQLASVLGVVVYHQSSEGTSQLYALKPIGVKNVSASEDDGGKSFTVDTGVPTDVLTKEEVVSFPLEMEVKTRVRRVKFVRDGVKGYDGSIFHKVTPFRTVLIIFEYFKSYQNSWYKKNIKQNEETKDSGLGFVLNEELISNSRWHLDPPSY